MGQADQSPERSEVASVAVHIDHALISFEALLKACYWWSRDYVCDVKSGAQEHSIVCIKAKNGTVDAGVAERFTATAMDFALREIVASKTAGVRDILLAKAFSESGVLEDSPKGTFGDVLEESRPDGMFKILSNG